MKDLAKGKSYVTITGKAKVTDKTFSGEITSERTGYKYTRLNLGIETSESNVIYGEMMGGYAPSNPIIYSMSKEDNKQLILNFADRLNEAVIESVSDFKLHKVGLERTEGGDLVIEKFLSPMDVHDYLQEHLKDGMDITVRGSFAFSEYKDEAQRKFEIQSIFLPYQAKEKDENGKETGNLLPVERHASFVQTVLLTEDSFKKVTKADAESGEVIIKAQAVDYVSKIDGKVVKKNMPFAVPITVKINKENPETTQKILKALFDVKKGKVREIDIEGTIVEGYEQQEVSSADIELSEEIKELIEMGLYSEEEAKSKMTVRGSKVSKLIFTRPYLQKDKDDAKKMLPFMSDDKYSTEDLFVQIEEEKVETNIGEEFKEETKEEASDDDWMNALGI